MSGVAKKLMGTTAAGGGGPLAIEDVFSCFLYTSNFSSLTLTNGINIPEFGGMTWFKPRTDAKLDNHIILDTERADTGSGRPYLITNSTAAQATSETPFYAGAATDWSSDGFKLGQTEYANGPVQGSNSGGGVNMASWTFRKAPRFFDVVTWTGDGTNNRSITHDLGVSPGTIITKATNVARSWLTWHRSLAVDNYLTLNTTNAVSSFSNTFGAPSDSDFIVGSGGTNVSGETYVAYLFAHDPLGPSGDGSDGLIACGSFNIASQATVEVDLGWETQFVMLKPSSTTGNWFMFDTMRGMAVNSFEWLYANSSAAAEFKAYQGVYPTPTGFGFNPANNGQLVDGDYIYIAIRRGPMRAPESGTEVFAPVARTATQATAYVAAGFTPDMLWGKRRTSTQQTLAWDRLRGVGQNLIIPSTAAESSAGAGVQLLSFDMDGLTLGSDSGFDQINGPSGATVANWIFKRAPEFFDVVAYTGDGVAGRTVPHNLGVAPEMMIVKSRSAALFWPVWTSAFPITQRLQLQDVDALGTQDMFNTLPTESVFYLSNALASNNSGDTYIAYLFASLAGVSKVGSYTGNGTSQTINCGFTSSARFIIIKRTDSTGDWYVWDTARGIVAANDPHLSLNSTAAEVTTDDSVDPVSSGFIVNQVAATNINVSAASYIFYSVS